MNSTSFKPNSILEASSVLFLSKLSSGLNSPLYDKKKIYEYHYQKRCLLFFVHNLREEVFFAPWLVFNRSSHLMVELDDCLLAFGDLFNKIIQMLLCLCLQIQKFLD